MNIFSRISKKPLVGIDIGEDSIKLVEGFSDTANVYVKNFAAVRTPANSFVNGNIVNLDAMAGAIKTALKENCFSSSRYSFTIDSSDILDRYIEVPAVDKKQVAKILDFEIPQQLPIVLSEHVIQTRIVEQTNTKEVKKSTALVVAMNKNMAASYLELSKLMGGAPHALDTIYDGMDKLLSEKLYINHKDRLAGKTVAVLDIGYSTVNINMFKNSNFIFNRIVEYGSKDIDMNIANLFNMELAEAKERKEHMGNINEEPLDLDSAESMVSTAVKSSVDKWATEINKVFKYFVTREYGNAVDAIYLYGGGSRILGLDRYLEDYFEIPTSHLKQMSNVVNESKGGEIPLDLYLNALTALIRLV